MSKAGCVTRLLFLLAISFGLGYLFFNYVYFPEEAPLRDSFFDDKSEQPIQLSIKQKEEELDSMIREANKIYGISFIDSLLYVESTNARHNKIRSLLNNRTTEEYKSK